MMSGIAFEAQWDEKLRYYDVQKINPSKGLDIQRFKGQNTIKRAMVSQPNLAVTHRYPMTVRSQKSTSLKQQNQIF